jgi:hypothetical protein
VIPKRRDKTSSGDFGDLIIDETQLDLGSSDDASDLGSKGEKEKQQTRHRACENVDRTETGQSSGMQEIADQSESVPAFPGIPESQIAISHSSSIGPERHPSQALEFEKSQFRSQKSSKKDKSRDDSLQGPGVWKSQFRKSQSSAEKSDNSAPRRTGSRT